MKICAMIAENESKLLGRLKNELKPEIFNKGRVPIPFLWSKLRAFLTNRNVTLRVHQRHRTVYTVANTLFPQEQGKANSLVLIKHLLTSTIYRSTAMSANEERSSGS